MNKPLLSCGLYAITDATLIPEGQLENAVKQAILGGARLIQYRDKSTNVERRWQQAQVLQALCSAHGIPLIINDDVDLTALVKAAGVHLGQDDPELETARARLGNAAIIGVSCYNRLELALVAAQAGANYVAFGSFFASPIKPGALRAQIELLRQAKRNISVPIVAIGGITPENGKCLIEAGADYLAVISGVFGQPDIRAAAQAYSKLYATCGESVT